MIEKKYNPVFEKFFADIELAAEGMLIHLEKGFNSKYQNYNDNHKPEFVRQQINEIIEKLNTGIDKGLPPKNSVSDNYKSSLSVYLKKCHNTISRAENIEFDTNLGEDIVVLGMNKTLSIHSNFYDLKIFHPLIRHIANIWFLDELNDLENQILQEQRKKTDNNQLTGFTCNLHPDTVKEIYIFMTGENHLSGKLTDFQAIFSKVSIPVETPVKWLIKNERGTNPDRGNQTALFVFLELILKKVSNQDLIKSKDLFIDEKGKFIKNKLLRPDKDKLKKYGFETQLKDILKKADQPKNQ